VFSDAGGEHFRAAVVGELNFAGLFNLTWYRVPLCIRMVKGTKGSASASSLSCSIMPEPPLNSAAVFITFHGPFPLRGTRVSIALMVAKDPTKLFTWKKSKRPADACRSRQCPAASFRLARPQDRSSGMRTATPAKGLVIIKDRVFLKFEEFLAKLLVRIILRNESVRPLMLTFPKGDDSQSLSFKLFDVSTVSFLIPSDLCLPVVGSGRRSSFTPGATVSPL